MLGPPPIWAPQARLVALGTAASAVTAWGLRGGTAAEGRAAAAFGAVAAANAGIFGYTMWKLMPVNRRLLAEGQVENEEGEDGIMRLLKQASLAASRTSAPCMRWRAGSLLRSRSA